MTAVSDGRPQGGARPRVVASDLDGTLVRSDGRISARSRRALEGAERAGALVVFVTGRPPRWMQPVIEETGASGLAICANGALVYDLGTGNIVREHALSPDIAGQLVESIREALPGVSFAVENGLQFGHEPDYVPGWPTPERIVADVDELIAEPVAKLLVKHPDRPPAEIYELVVRLAGETAMVTYSGDVLLEVSGAGVSKASTLADLCAARGVEAADVIAFGDMPNDIPMLRWAGRAVAVGNAHHEVLAVADEVTASNDEDGVAQVLERMFGLAPTTVDGPSSEL